MARTLLQLKDGRWEEVDTYTSKNMKNALADDSDDARYTGDWVVIKDDGSFRLSGNFSPNDIRWLLRFIGAPDHGLSNVSVPGGMIVEPKMIRFMIRSKKVIHVLGTNETYRQVA